MQADSQTCMRIRLPTHIHASIRELRIHARMRTTIQTVQSTLTNRHVNQTGKGTFMCVGFLLACLWVMLAPGFLACARFPICLPGCLPAFLQAGVQLCRCLRNKRPSATFEFVGLGAMDVSKQC